MSAERDQGLNAMQNGNATEAIPLLEQATLADPTDYQAFLYLGAAYGQTGQQDEAVSALTQAVQLQPSNAQARYNLGLAMEQAGYIEQALQVYQQALQLQPDYPKATEALLRLQPASVPPPPTVPSYPPPASAPASDYAPPAQAAPIYPPPAPQYAPPPQPGYAPPPGPSGIYGQPPAGPPMYAPPPAYGQMPPGQPPVYPGGFAPGNFQVPQKCKEAEDALVYAIMSVFCIGIVFGPIALWKASQAKRLIAENPYLTGSGSVTAAFIIGGIMTTLNYGAVLLFVIRIIAGGGR